MFIGQSSICNWAPRWIEPVFIANASFNADISHQGHHLQYGMQNIAFWLVNTSIYFGMSEYVAQYLVDIWRVNIL